MKRIKLPDAFIHPRSNQLAHGHAGRIAEVKMFHILQQTVDPDVRWATKNENIYKKYDIVSSIELYGKKAIKAEKEALTKGTIWIEYQNGDGKDGWIYGQADYIVFDLFTEYLAIDRVWLQLITDKLTKETVFTGDYQIYNKYVPKYQALYKPYRRSGRKDILTKIKLEDIYYKPSWKIEIPLNLQKDEYRTNT